MRFFLPAFDPTATERMLMEVRHIARPGDCLIVMAPVLVPQSLPVDVEAGAIWKQVCRAERRLFHAREAAERSLTTGVTLRFVRVQARDDAAAIRTGAAHYDADVILLDLPRGLRGAFALRFGAVAAVLRSAPCTVRFVGTTAAEETTTLTTSPPIAVAPFATLEIIAVNPALAAAGAKDSAREIEGQPAS